MTDKNVYKVILSNKKVIGKFDWTGVTSNSTLSSLGMAVIDTQSDSDGLMILEPNRILYYTEPNTLVNVLNKIDYKINTIEDILFSGEYFNNITFNSKVGKIVENHQLLLDSIVGQFSYMYDSNKVAVLSAIIPITSKNIYMYYNDCFVGVNETPSPQVLNRCIGSIYNIQVQILSTVIADYINDKYPIAEVVNF
jgi:hypothetical protein